MSRRPDDAGFTLAELLLATAVMITIIPALTGAMIVGWRTTDDTINRLSENRNRAITNSLWSRDVASADTVDTNAADTTCLAGGDTLLARISWTETPTSGSPVTRVAAWVWTGSTTQLVERRYCATGGAITSSGTTAHDVATAPVPTCRTASGSAAACSASTVSAQLTVTDAGGSFVASGRRRSS